MSSLFGFPIRTLAFVRKEIVEVLRQPRLVLLLIFGPFLILLIFGIGYRNEPRAMRALFVAQPDSELQQHIEEYASTLGPQLIYMGTTADEEAAKAQLRQGQVDLVVVTPTDSFDTIGNNQQATFQVYHREIDPSQARYVEYLARLYVDEVNRRVLQSVTRDSQDEASELQAVLAAARGDAASTREALQGGDASAAREHQQSLDSNVSRLLLLAGVTAQTAAGVQSTTGSSSQTDPNSIMSLLTAVRDNTHALGQIPDNSSNYNSQAQQASQVEQDLATLESRLDEFQNIDPAVLVSPFRSEAQSVATIQPGPVDYYAPSVIALLLQHLAVTVAALSIVRDRQLGTIELFRVAPVSSAETLIGKYLSYLLLGGVIAAVLTALMVFVLKVPMLGDGWNLATVIAAVLFTSLGFGFVISLLSQTDSQAVQFTMILLLTSVFFSGFLLNLDALWEPVRVVSWALPTTYGVQLLQNIMLRGVTPSWLLLLALVVIGVVLCLLAWMLLRRVMRNAR